MNTSNAFHRNLRGSQGPNRSKADSFRLLDGNKCAPRVASQKRRISAPGGMTPNKNPHAYVRHLKTTLPPAVSMLTVSIIVAQLVLMSLTVLPAKRGKLPRARIRSTCGSGGECGDCGGGGGGGGYVSSPARQLTTASKQQSALPTHPAYDHPITTTPTQPRGIFECQICHPGLSTRNPKRAPPPQPSVANT